MNSSLTLAVTILLLTSTTALPSNARDNRLDPGRITWWRSTWTPRPIELTRTNSGETVNFTFRFTPSTTITSGCIEIYFPASIVPPNAQNGNYYSNCDSNPADDTFVTLTAGKDESYQVSSVPLTTSGQFGPFTIITRDKYAGQIVDINKMFGSVYLTAARTASAASLSVAPANGAAITIKQVADVVVTVDIPIDLWRNDYLVLYVPSQWTIKNTPACSSVDVSDTYTNYFKGMDGSNKLDCVGDFANKIIYVYGLYDEIDINIIGADQSSTRTLKLKISGLRAPGVDYDESTYIWNMEIWRFAVPDVQAKFTGSGPTTATGVMKISNWRPYHGRQVDRIPTASTMYMSLDVQLTNGLPANGEVRLQFTGVNVFDPFWKYDAAVTTGVVGAQQYCYVLYLQNVASCTVSNNQLVTVQFNSALEDAAEFTLAVLANFASTEARVSGETALQAVSTKIDTTGTDVNLITVNADVLRNTSFKLTFTDAAGANPINNTGGNSARDYIYVQTQLRASDFASGAESSEVSVHLPINTTGLSHQSIYLNGASGQFNCIVNLVNSAAAVTGPSTQVATVDTSNMKFTFTVNLNSQVGFNALCYNGSTPSDNLLLPMVESNKVTRYESRIVVKIGSTEYVRFQPLTFTASTITASAVRVCGGPIYFEFTPPFTQTVSGESKRYYLDLVFTAYPGTSDLDSGLTLGDTQYPIGKVQNINDAASLQLADDRLQLINQSTFQGNSVHAFYTIAGAATTYDVEWYFIDLNVNTSEKFYFARTTGAPMTAPTESATSTIAKAATVSEPFDITYEARTYTTGTMHFAAVFPQGYSFNSLAYLRVGTDSVNPLYKLQSSNPNFKFPALVGSFTADNTSRAIQASGVVGSAYEQSNLGFKYGAYVGADNLCFANQSGSFSVTKGSITDIVYEPSTVEARSPNSYAEDLSVKFKTAHPIPSGGKIFVQTDSDWTVIATTCKVSGLTDIDENTKLTCTYSNPNWVVQNFAGVQALHEIKLTWEASIPPASQAKSVMKGHIDALYTSYNSMKIDELQTINNESCEVTKPVSAGRSKILESRSIPPNAVESGVDLYLKFKLEHDLPIGATIAIQNGAGSWSEGTFTNQAVFFSKKYSDVTITTNTVSLTLAESVKVSQDTLELYIQRMMKNPASTFEGYHKITTTYYGVIFDQDTDDNITEDHKVAVSADIASIITQTSVSVSLNPVTADTYSTYTFNFQPDINVLATDRFWILFPLEFDPYLGNVYEKYQYEQPDTYYIDCSSEQLGANLECIVDRWYLILLNLNAITEETPVSVMVYDIMNPAATSPATTGAFHIYQVDSANVGKSRIRNIAGVTTTAIPDNIKVKTQSATTRSLFGISDYTFSVYGNETLQQIDQIFVKLPEQYKISLTPEEDIATCVLTYVNHSLTSDNLDVRNIPGNTTCVKSRNSIQISLVEFSADIILNETTLLNININEMLNPEWGYDRQQKLVFVDEFELNDNNVFPKYDVWTNQYVIQIYNSETKQITSRTYLNMNVNYLGFTQRFRHFVVNDNETIQVRPGTQTEGIKITASDGRPMASKYVLFTPTTNEFTTLNTDKLEYGSETGFNFYHLEDSLEFTVSASIEMPEGLYYINWATEQTYTATLTDQQYDPPAKTRLEVSNRDKVEFEVADIRPIGVGNTSPPVKVCTENSPYLDITLTLGIAELDITNIKLTPPALVFNRGDHCKYFTVGVPEGYDTTGNVRPHIKFTLSGTDAIAFKAPDNKQFDISDVTISHEGTLLSITVSDVTKTSASIQATANSDGIIYYYIGAYGTQAPTSFDIIAEVGDYFGLEESASEDVVEYQPPEIEPTEADDNDIRLDGWVAFSRRKYLEHRQKVIKGASVSVANQQTDVVSLDDLFADTLYYIWAIVENASESKSEPLVQTFRTLPMDEAAIFSISFNADIPESSLEPLRNLSAGVMGVIPERLIGGVKITARRTQDTTQQDQQNQEEEQNQEEQPTTPSISQTTFRYYLPAERRLESPSPYEQANLSTDQKTYLKQQIKDILSITQTPTFTTQRYSRSDLVVPEYDQGLEPSTENSTSTVNSITVSMKTDIAGECCCLATSRIDTNVNDAQLLIGLDEKNEAATYTCVDYDDVSTSASVTVTGLNSSTDYQVACMCYNSYPLWPISVQYGEDSNIIKSFKVRTADPIVQDVEDDDFAMNLGVLAIMLMVVF